MKKKRFITVVFVTIILILLNFDTGSDAKFMKSVNAQSGTNFFDCANHPDECDLSGVGCQGGVDDAMSCLINCPPYTGAPWINCNATVGED